MGQIDLFSISSDVIYARGHVAYNLFEWKRECIDARSTPRMQFLFIPEDGMTQLHHVKAVAVIQRKRTHAPKSLNFNRWTIINQKLHLNPADHTRN